MKKSRLLGALCACLLTVIETSTHAVSIPGQGTWKTTLEGRDLDGVLTTAEAYYDTVLDITWLADANILGVQLSWDSAMNWADNLVLGGYSNWRLPTVGPVTRISYSTGSAHDGSTDFGYNISAPGTIYAGSMANEMSHLFYNTLGNAGWYQANGTLTGCASPDYCLSNTGPFSNMQLTHY